ncbi:MaoC family dehydratase N-terminal domain-containing protein [Streptomyces sp. NPDC050617]|uniref:FAS1-like dehydratase domain-containing protein n=1 Tax=Streptomyces sp. NPDC050617 TaxID=3154628 RepID=UPI003437C678
MGKPLLTDEARGWVGREFDMPPFTVTEKDIRKYEAGLGNTVPAHPDTAQPLLYTALVRPIAPVAELGADGLTEDRRAPVGEGRVMFGGIDVELVRPLVVGDQVRGRRRLESLEEKHGRRGPFVLATWRTEYVDASGDPVIREASTQILK